MQQFFTNTLPKNTLRLTNEFQNNQPIFLNNFYLTAGTALSLLLGHRESEDLDFFTQDKFEPQKLQQELEKFGSLTDLELADGTLNTFINDVKLQFLHYPYTLIEPVFDWNGIRVSSKVDIACTKLQTIATRGSKKDFIDLYFLLKEFTLAQLFKFSKKKYPKVDYNQIHILKSLTYFEDANQQPMPKMHIKVSWEEIKKKLIEQVKEYNFLN
jgi:predicted nucleotidyltransferase component of viral defense system